MTRREANADGTLRKWPAGFDILFRRPAMLERAVRLCLRLSGAVGDTRPYMDILVLVVDPAVGLCLCPHRWRLAHGCTCTSTRRVVQASLVRNIVHDRPDHRQVAPDGLRLTVVSPAPECYRIATETRRQCEFRNVTQRDSRGVHVRSPQNKNAPLLKITTHSSGTSSST